MYAFNIKAEFISDATKFFLLLKLLNLFSLFKFVTRSDSDFSVWKKRKSTEKIMQHFTAWVWYHRSTLHEKILPGLRAKCVAVCEKLKPKACIQYSFIRNGTHWGASKTAHDAMLGCGTKKTRWQCVMCLCTYVWGWFCELVQGDEVSHKIINRVFVELSFHGTIAR